MVSIALKTKGKTKSGVDFRAYITRDVHEANSFGKMFSAYVIPMDKKILIIIK